MIQALRCLAVIVLIPWGSACSGGDSAREGLGGTGAVPASSGGSGAGAASAAGNGGASSGGTGVIAPPSHWQNVTSNLGALAAGGGDVSALRAQPGTTRIIAGVGTRGLFATDDSGASWFALGSGAGSAPINNRPAEILFDRADATRFWEVGIYGDGVFHTTDDGETLTRLGDISHNDYLGVDFTDPDRLTLLAGGHEQKQTLFLSKDGGQQWLQIGSAIPSEAHFSSTPIVLDAQTFLLGSCGWGDGECGVYRSSNGGESWISVTPHGPAGAPLVASNGSIYWPAIYDGGMLASHDAGVTWTKTNGPVMPHSGGPEELPDGRILALGKTHLLVSADAGSSWQQIGEAMPHPGQNCGIYGFTYSPELKTFFLNHNNCSGQIATSAVYSAGWDYQAH